MNLNLLIFRLVIIYHLSKIFVFSNYIHLTMKLLVDIFPLVDKKIKSLKARHQFQYYDFNNLLLLGHKSKEADKDFYK